MKLIPKNICDTFDNLYKIIEDNIKKELEEMKEKELNLDGVKKFLKKEDLKEQKLDRISQEEYTDKTVIPFCSCDLCLTYENFEEQLGPKGGEFDYADVKLGDKNFSIKYWKDKIVDEDYFAMKEKVCLSKEEKYNLIVKEIELNCRIGNYNKLSELILELNKIDLIN